MRTYSRVLAFAVCLCAAVPTIAQQPWPVKPVRLISQVAAGTVTDIVARLYAEQMAKALGQPWIVENRPGGEGMISLEATARSAPDGYTFMLASQTIVINPLMLKSMSVDPARDLVPAATIVDTAAFALVANAALPARNLDGVVALAKSQPGKVSYGITVPVSGMFGKWLSKRTAIDLLEVSYKTTQQLLADTISGEISMSVTSLPGIAELVQAGRVRVLAVSSPVRLKGWEDVPTIGEAGFPEATVISWYGLHAPANTPAAVMRKLEAAIKAAVQKADTQNRLVSAGGEAAYLGTDEFTRFVASDGQMWEGINRMLRK